MIKVDYLYSDPHFGHGNIIKYVSRPFQDVLEMDRVLMERYNETVGPDDTCLWLGDAFFGFESWARDMLARMNGRKLLVMGNHEKSKAAMTRIGFEVLSKTAVFLTWDGEIRSSSRVFKATHYPYGPNRRNRPRRGGEQFLIHGHTHSPDRVWGNTIHVGVDAWDFRPVPWSEVELLARAHSVIRRLF